MSGDNVDEYVRTTVPAQHQVVVGRLRELMGEHADGALEVISRGSLVWKGEKILAIISVSKTHLTLAFARGAEFNDAHGLLEGVGKTTRHIKIKNVEAVNHAALREASAGGALG